VTLEARVISLEATLVPYTPRLADPRVPAEAVTFEFTRPPPRPFI
jgi:hypothetical protein